MHKPKIDWKKVWDTFFYWHDENFSTPTIKSSPDCMEQLEKIQQLVEKQLEHKAGQGKPVFSKKD